MESLKTETHTFSHKEGKGGGGEEGARMEKEGGKTESVPRCVYTWIAFLVAPIWSRLICLYPTTRPRSAHHTRYTTRVHEQLVRVRAYTVKDRAQEVVISSVEWLRRDLSRV